MAQDGARHPSQSLSALLAKVEVQGRTWCYTDLRGGAGFSLPPGEAVLFHVVLHGSVRLACAGGEVAELGRADAVFVPTGEAHAIRTDAGSATSVHSLLREDRPVDVPPTAVVGTAGPVRARVLSGRLQTTWPEAANRTALPGLLRASPATADALLQPDALALAGIGPGAAALLTRIAAMLLVSGLRTDPRCREVLRQRERDPAGEALRLIRGDPAASWTVEKLARAVGMGRSSFAAHFTQALGRAPMEVVTEHRMDQAAAMLRQGRLKVAEIGELAGYSSEAAFSRRFTRHFGMPPSQMREQAQAARDAGSSPPAFRPLLSALRER